MINLIRGWVIFSPSKEDKTREICALHPQLVAILRRGYYEDAHDFTSLFSAQQDVTLIHCDTEVVVGMSVCDQEPLIARIADEAYRARGMTAPGCLTDKTVLLVA